MSHAVTPCTPVLRSLHCQLITGSQWLQTTSIWTCCCGKCLKGSCPDLGFSEKGYWAAILYTGYFTLNFAVWMFGEGLGWCDGREELLCNGSLAGQLW